MSITSEKPDYWEAPDKRFCKIFLSKGFGFCCPQDGSVCKIRVLSDSDNILTDVDSEQMKELIVGDVDEPVDRVLEACVRTMKNEEICLMKFPDPLHVAPPCDKKIGDESQMTDCPIDQTNDAKLSGEVKANEEDNVESDDLEDKADESKTTETENDCVTSEKDSGIGKDSESEDRNKCEITSEGESETQSNVESMEKTDPEAPIQSSESVDECSEAFDSIKPKIYEVQLQLFSYTREPEIFEMSITEKWRRANYHKQKGMELYARGCYEWAFRRFGLALKYIISLEHDLPSGQEEGMNITGLKLSSFLNVAACQMRHHNYEAVVKNCSKALHLQSNNAKALYRRGAAYLQLQEYEKAKVDLNKAQELEPKNQAIVNQLQLLKAQVQKLNQYYANAMKKMFT